MQTFLPVAEFAESARLLDSPRLGKQRVETLQILRAIELPDYGWANHPAVLMWRGRTPALVAYGLAMARIWRERGFADTTEPQIGEFAPDVVELHVGLDRTVCLACGDVAGRAELDERLRAANPDFGPRVDEVNPDGDAELPDEVLDGFVMVGCLACGDGPLKPDVVFFGETVPRDRVEQCFRLVEDAGSLLVLGSSLTVMSGYRFVLRAAKLGIPVAIVTVGPTRGDAKADVRVDAPLGDVLPELTRRLAG